MKKSRGFQTGRVSTGILLSLIASLGTASLLSGCATYPACLDLSQVPPGRALPIDGLWKSSSGVVFRIEKGRLYTTSKLEFGLPPNRVLTKNIRRLRPGHYEGYTASFNKAKHMSAYGPQSIDIVTANGLRVIDGPNPETAFKGSTSRLTSYQLDDEQAFLSEFIEVEGAPPSEVAVAVRRSTNQALLMRLAMTAKDVSVRKVAVERVADESVLAQVASDDGDAAVRQHAVAKIQDKALLVRLAMTAGDASVRRVAVERVSDESVLELVASNDGDTAIRQRAAARIQDQALLMRLAMTAGDVSVRKVAVERVADESVLAQVASDDGDAAVRQHAVARIQDQALLAKVVTGAKDWDIRKVAFGRIHDADQVAAVASSAGDEAVRMAANVRLGRSSWSDIINEAQQNEAKIGPAISAIAWAEKQEALVVEITGLCHRYIRRGDVARIPELRELLRLYGDKALAEDYLNCGQSDLDAAGREWANSHGYYVGPGFGSHRVRWGEDRR